MNLILYIVIGALISLLLNYLADVLPETRKLSRPFCRQCGEPFSLKAYLFSFRCPECGEKPARRYWIVLILCMVISVMLAYFPLKTFTYWQSLPLAIFLGLILIIDIEHHAVLFETDFVGIVVGLVYGFMLHKPLETLLGGVVGAAAMFLLYMGGILFNRVLSRIRKQEIDEVALGFGDVIVCGYLGLIAGIQHVAGFLLLAVIFSGIFAICYLIFKAITRKYSAFTAIPYVPFLVLGLITLFYLP
jgi:leader peptidase (prepilin peptidase)/N-methyltransferase